MSNPIEDYLKGTKAVPLPPNSQQEGEQYNEIEKAIEGQTESQTKLAIEINKDLEERYERKRRYEAEKALYESNQQEGEEIEYNSQRELDDLEQSEPDYGEDNHLEDDEFTGNYFAQPDENEEKSSLGSSLGDKIRAKYESFKASASDTAENLSSTFGASFGAAAGAASAKYSRFKKGDPIFAVQSPVRRGKSPSRYISRAGRNISRPNVGGRFGDYNPIGFTGQYVPQNQAYYPQDGYNRPQGMAMYIPSGSPQYEGEFSNFNARNEFKNSKYANTKEDTYDPFGFGGLSGDGFANTNGFGSSLMGFGGDNGIFGGSAGNDTVFGNFGGGKTGKMDILGDSGMFAIGDLVSPPAVRKTTTKRKSASRKTAKKASKAKPTRRKQATRKQNNGFVLP